MPTAAAKEPEEYKLFLESLGITDGSKVSFLAALLRDVYEASTKLDLHLEPYGASFHSAISRLLTTDNPQDVPSLCWIRVVDRMGFFTDDDAHGKRIVNVGLAFAYRHKQLDALAAAGIFMQEDHAVKVRTVEVGGDDDCAIRLGGAIVRDQRGVANAAGPAKATSGPPKVEASLAVKEGVVEEDGGRVVAGGVVVDRRGADEAPSGTGAGAALPVPGAAGAQDDEDPSRAAGLLPGGIVVDRRLARSEAGEADDTQGGLGGRGATGKPSTVHERQPLVTPSADALKAVAFVLRVVEAHEDAPNVLRGLLLDSLMFLVRSRSTLGKLGAASADGSDGVPGEKATASAVCLVNNLVDGWWPTWEAPRDGGKMRPVPGTFGYETNSLRAVWKTRWCIKVDMGDTNPALERLHEMHKRAFEPDGRPPAEVVIRLVGSRPLRLTVVVASMLLMSTKEPDYCTILMQLASTGRAGPQRGSRLAAASVHEFVASAVTQASPSARQDQPAGGRDGTTAAALPKQAFVGEPKKSLEEEYANMAVTLAAEKVSAAAGMRAARKRALQAKGGGGPSSSTATRAPPNGTGSGGQAANRRQSASGAPGNSVTPAASSTSLASTAAPRAAAPSRKRPRPLPSATTGAALSSQAATSGGGTPVAKRASNSREAPQEPPPQTPVRPSSVPTATPASVPPPT